MHWALLSQQIAIYIIYIYIWFYSLQPVVIKRKQERQPWLELSMYCCQSQPISCLKTGLTQTLACPNQGLDDSSLFGIRTKQQGHQQDLQHLNLALQHKSRCAPRQPRHIQHIHHTHHVNMPRSPAHHPPPQTWAKLCEQDSVYSTYNQHIQTTYPNRMFWSQLSKFHLRYLRRY